MALWLALNLLDLLAVPDPDVVGLSAAVVLPGAELAESAVVGQALSVRAPAAESAFRKRQGVAHAALRGHGP